MIKRIIRKIIGKEQYAKLMRTRMLAKNFYQDFLLYKRYSLLYNPIDFKNKEADLIIQYHGLEKGMLHEVMKPRFAEYRIKSLHQLLNDKEIREHIHLSQIRVGYEVMCRYYELHQQKGISIEDIYPKERYEFYRKTLGNYYSSAFKGIVEYSKQDFYQHLSGDFKSFAQSRKSIRNFTGEKVSVELLHQSIQLANTAPSVCNRQASTVYLLEDKSKIDKALAIQGGFSGYSENVRQLLILTNDRRYYYTIGERNQLFIDGGIYLMNLLYALHYYQIANCPANWGKTIQDEKHLSEFVKIPESEKIICMIPIGIATDHFRTTLSERRIAEENFKILE